MESYRTLEWGSRHRRYSRFGVLFALLAVATACTELEVFPQRLQMAASSTATIVEVTARYRKTKGGKILNDPITWRSDMVGVQFDPTPSGRNVRISIPSGSPGTRIRIEVTAGSKSDELLIEIVAPSGDRATALGHLTPSVLMMVGDAGNCPSEQTIAFVQLAALASRDDGCTTTNVVRLSAYAPPTQGAITWTPGADPVDFPTAAGLRSRPLRVWLLNDVEHFLSQGMTEADVTTLFAKREEFMNQSIAEANGVLYASRVGLKLVQIGTARPIVSVATNCAELLAQIAQDDDNSGVNSGIDNWNADAINVYVMERFTGSRGQYCRSPDGAAPHNVIRLQHPDALIGTLVHEIGHLWGLVVPWGVNAVHTGHVDAIKAFQRDNVMWAGVDITTTAPRTRFSIGQVYRIHFDRRSTLAPGSNVDCGCDPYGVPCGRLSRDVRPLPRAVGALGASANACEAPWW